MFSLLPTLLAQPVPPAVPIDDGLGLAKLLIDAFNNKQWGIFVSLALVFLVFVFRWLVGRLASPDSPPSSTDTLLTKFSRWIHSPIVSWALPTVGSVAGALASWLLSGQPFSIGLLVSAIVIGLTSNGLFNGAQKLKESHELAKDAAATNVRNIQDAVSVIDKNAKG